MSMEFPNPYNPEETGDGFDLLPAGEYVAQAIEGRVGPPKTGNGQQLTLVWNITEGEHENRQVWQNIGFLHPKAGAQFYGQKMLNSVIAAVGCVTPLETVEPLLWTPVRIGIVIEKDPTGAYPDKNRVVKVRAFNGEAGEAVPPQQPAGSPIVGPAMKRCSMSRRKSCPSCLPTLPTGSPRCWNLLVTRASVQPAFHMRPTAAMAMARTRRGSFALRTGSSTIWHLAALMHGYRCSGFTGAVRPAAVTKQCLSGGHRLPVANWRSGTAT
jgi:hypothetical protein